MSSTMNAGYALVDARLDCARNGLPFGVPGSSNESWADFPDLIESLEKPSYNAMPGIIEA